MALSKSDREEIDVLFQKAINEGQNKAKDKYKQTEKRLYAYPILKRNIIRYRLDIEDIKVEDMKKSKDFVMFLKNSGSAEKPDLEELRAARILLIKRNIARDEREIAEIDSALKEVEKDEYFKVIEMCYFSRKNQEEVAEIMNCDKVTTWRRKKRLIQNIAVCLYGADAL